MAASEIQEIKADVKMVVEVIEYTKQIMTISFRGGMNLKKSILVISSNRSSCTDDGLLYIYPATFSDFEHLCLSLLLQVSL